MFFLLLLAFGGGMTGLYHVKNRDSYSYGEGPVATFLFGGIVTLLVSVVASLALSGVTSRTVYVDTQPLTEIADGRYITTREVSSDLNYVWQTNKDGEAKMRLADASHVDLSIVDGEGYVRNYKKQGASWIWPGSDGMEFFTEHELYIPEGTISTKDRIKAAVGE